MCVCVRACAQVCVCSYVCCSVGADGCVPLTMLVDVCQLSFAYVWMLTDFRDTFLVVKPGE